LAGVLFLAGVLVAADVLVAAGVLLTGVLFSLVAVVLLTGVLFLAVVLVAGVLFLADLFGAFAAAPLRKALTPRFTPSLGPLGAALVKAPTTALPILFATLLMTDGFLGPFVLGPFGAGPLFTGVSRRIPSPAFGGTTGTGVDGPSGPRDLAP
jgi:hypothetical protein|tara:strand:- start:3980 stop:4438 length:459 start_codon:yes stop_codon:yes gene_type:complete